MEVKSTAKIRTRATDWLNSKNKDISAGIKIMEDANYKPNVMQNFRKHMFRRDIPQKLMQEIRNYLRYYVTQGSEIHKDIVVDTDSIEKLKIVGQDLKSEYPESVKKIIQELSDVYKIRGKFHTSLSKTGEGNSSTQKTDRRQILAIIKACSDRITVLSEAFELFKKEGVIPSPELTKEAFDPDKVKVDKPQAEKQEKTFVLADTLEDLKKQQDGWRIKITKAENKLLYQSEKRLPKQNPMPAGPKRIKQEKRIARLKAEKNKIDLAIVNWE